MIRRPLVVADAVADASAAASFVRSFVSSFAHSGGQRGLKAAVRAGQKSLGAGGGVAARVSPFAFRTRSSASERSNVYSADRTPLCFLNASFLFRQWLAR